MSKCSSDGGHAKRKPGEPGYDPYDFDSEEEEEDDEEEAKGKEQESEEEMETEPSSDKGGGVKGMLSDERYCTYSLLMECMVKYMYM